MRPIVLTAAVAALLAGATPAGAVPPVVVSGTGWIGPGIVLPFSVPRPTTVWFTGTATEANTTYPCTIAGTGTNVPPGGVTGTLGVDCGPAQGSQCPFTLTPTSWLISCPGGTSGTLFVTYPPGTFVDTFSANGVLL